ncbi:hypothetical protein JS533_007575 [Bifidobacterium amazonense]|uniref:Uncharacterized protein n=1 Tax=Bifidobacterium amazonense TaxID=2809027 RepID=A0ABS9VVK4_9BIFI|nr:hypothetical protein [Bifidobacterium amazonense]MCH9276128.1 hypothetical protein [Bifidobacterium amazonense]
MSNSITLELPSNGLGSGCNILRCHDRAGGDIAILIIARDLPAVTMKELRDGLVTQLDQQIKASSNKANAKPQALRADSRTPSTTEPEPD